jgi:anti-sigma factor RsiW
MTTTCADAHDWIERRLDGVSSAAEDAALDAHVATCRACASLLTGESEVDAALASHFSDRRPPAGFATRVRTRVGGEAPSDAHGWVADVLNAVGVLVSLGLLAPLLGGLDGGLTRAVLWLTALAALCYPMIMASLVGEVGPSAGAGD